MSVDRREKKVSRRFIVNGLGALSLAAAGAYALGRPTNNGETNLVAPPAHVTLPKTPTIPENCTIGFKGDLLCSEPTSVEPRPLPKATARATLVQPLDDHYRGTVDRVVGSNEIIGAFPTEIFEFSNDVKEAGLIPTVFVNEPAQERLSRSIDYIGRLHKILSRKPEYRSKPLASLAINTPQNFPIAFGKDATVFEVLEDFLKDKAFGNIILDPNPIRGADFHLGTIGTPVFRNNRWGFSSETRLNMIIIDEKTNLEDKNTAYYQTTDLQFALKLLHEYSHFKQDQALMAEVMKDRQLMQSIGQDPEKMRAAIVQKAQEHKARIARELNIQPGTFSPNEAQANTISQLALNTLEEINKGKRVPGAEDDNPIAEGNNSRLNKFREFVLGNHALDRRWLLMHNW